MHAHMHRHKLAFSYLEREAGVGVSIGEASLTLRPDWMRHTVTHAVHDGPWVMRACVCARLTDIH